MTKESKGENKQVDAITSKALDDLFEDTPKPKAQRSTGKKWWQSSTQPTTRYNPNSAPYVYNDEPYDWSASNRDMFGRSSTQPYNYKSTYDPRTALDMTINDDCEDNSRDGQLNVDKLLLKDMTQYVDDEVTVLFEQQLNIHLGQADFKKLAEWLAEALENGDYDKHGHFLPIVTSE